MLCTNGNVETGNKSYWKIFNEYIMHSRKTNRETYLIRIL